MEEDIKGAIERLSKAQNDIWYATLYSQEEQDRDIETVIKGYRELEKGLDNSRKANELLNKTNNELRWEIRTTYSKAVNDIISKFNLGDEYIPKSKAKEKIEEINQEKLNYSEDEWYLESEIKAYAIEKLQELMEDK